MFAGMNRVDFDLSVYDLGLGYEVWILHRCHNDAPDSFESIIMKGDFEDCPLYVTKGDNHLHVLGAAIMEFAKINDAVQYHADGILAESRW